MKNDNIYGLIDTTNLLNIIASKQIYIGNLIKEELSKDMKNVSFNSFPPQVSQRYKNYIYITIKIDNKEYWITFFANDIDENSANIHTEIGQIEYWKKIRELNKKSQVNLLPRDIKETVNKDNYKTLINTFPKGYLPIGIAYPSNTITKHRKAQKSNFTIDTIKTNDDIRDVVNEFYNFLFADMFPNDFKENNYEKKSVFLANHIYICKECGYCIDLKNTSVCPICETKLKI